MDVFKGFLTGSIAGSFATCCIQPIDMVKVRVQINASEGGVTNPVTIASTMIKEEGFLSLYNGLGAGLLRQVVYTGSRLGLYDVFTDTLAGAEKRKLGLLEAAGCGLAAGGLGCTIGCPADVCLVRMQTDSMLPQELRKNYSGVGAALGDIVKSEGPMGLFNGVGPTASRAMALNMGMLAGNMKAKDMLEDYGVAKKGEATNTLSASMIAGFLGAFLCIPFDFVKTQMQKMKPDPVTGEYPFKGPVDCARQTIATKGPLGFYAGFPVFYARIAPHATITLLAQNEVKKLWPMLGL